MMSDSPTSWADRSEMPPDVCTITTDPTSEQDRALVNNLRMTDARVAAGNPVASLASVAASILVPQPSQNATETKFLYPLLFAQSIVSNVLKIMVNFIFVKS